MADALIDGVNGARPALEQRREYHRLEKQVECGKAHALEQKIRRKRRLLNLGIEGDHRNEEKDSRKHRERAGDDA